MKTRIRIPIPEYLSEITSHVVELEKLKVRSLSGTTNARIFLQIKSVFQLLESLGSARIEGNRTTIEELIDASFSGEGGLTEPLREIYNIEDAMGWIEEEFARNPLRRIDREFLKELHRITLKHLRSPDEGGEGDRKLGAFRSQSVRIAGSLHRPPSPFELDEHIDELIGFINAVPDPRTDLLRIAIAHHRFEYVHPFRNGNGRVGRLLTYAMLIRSGFRVGNGRILNPSAMFCDDRVAYMTALSAADSGKEEDLLAWCSFVLRGLKREILRIDRLLDNEVLTQEILLPTIRLACRRRFISDDEATVLMGVCREQVADASLFRHFFPDRSASSVSQVIARFKRQGLLLPVPKANSRSYCVNFLGKDLVRALVTTLHGAGFLSAEMNT